METVMEPVIDRSVELRQRKRGAMLLRYTEIIAKNRTASTAEAEELGELMDDLAIFPDDAVRQSTAKKEYDALFPIAAGKADEQAKKTAAIEFREEERKRIAQAQIKLKDDWRRAENLVSDAESRLDRANSAQTKVNSLKHSFPWLFRDASGEPLPAPAPAIDKLVSIDARLLKIEPGELYSPNQLADLGADIKAMEDSHLPTLAAMYFGASVLAWANEMRRRERLRRREAIKARIVFVDQRYKEIEPDGNYRSNDLREKYGVEPEWLRVAGVEGRFGNSFRGSQILTFMDDRAIRSESAQRELAAMDLEDGIESTTATAPPEPVVKAAPVDVDTAAYEQIDPRTLAPAITESAPVSSRRRK